MAGTPPSIQSLSLEKSRNRVFRLIRRPSRAGTPRSNRRPRGIVVRPHRRGGTEIRFPIQGLERPVVLSGLFALALLGITAALRVHSAPLALTFATAGSSAMLLYGALLRAFSRTRVIVRSHGILVQDRLLLMRRTRRISATRVESIALEAGLRAGGTIRWDLRLHTVDERPRSGRAHRGIRAGGGIRDRRDAERLAALMLDTLDTQHAAAS